MEDASAWRDKYFGFLQFERRFSPCTLAAYRCDLEQFFDFCKLHAYDPLHADFRQCRQWLVSLSQDGLSPRSVNRKITALRSFYKYLVRSGAVGASPMEKSGLMKVGRKLPVVVPEDGMMQLLSSDVSDMSFPELRDFLLVATLYLTGMRRAELTALKTADVDLTQMTVRITGKRDKQRVVPLLPGFCKWLGTYLRLRDQQPFDCQTDFFFVLDNGRQVYAGKVYNVCRRMLSEVTTQSKRSPHVLRHSFATHMLQHHADLDAIKTLLGHAGLAATQVYTHNSLHTIKSIYNHAHPRA